MSDDESKERLSCLMDSALGSSEARFLARRLGHDEALRSCWRRYHLLGDVLRAERRRHAADLAGRVASVLNDEDVPRRAPRPARWLKPAAGMAVAATVALAVVNVFQGPRGPGEAVAEAPAALEIANYDATPSLPQRASTASGARLASERAINDPRLQAFLLRHNEAAVRRGQGLVPYIYLVTAPEPGENADAVPASEPTVAD